MCVLVCVCKLASVLVCLSVCLSRLVCRLSVCVSVKRVCVCENLVLLSCLLLEDALCDGVAQLKGKACFGLPLRPPRAPEHEAAVAVRAGTEAVGQKGGAHGHVCLCDEP